MGRKYQLISGDGHLETPPDPWVKYVPEAHRPRSWSLTVMSVNDHVAFLDALCHFDIESILGA